MEKPTPKQLYDFVNSDKFTRDHLSVFVAALLDKEWTEHMGDDLNTFGYNMTVDEFIGWKVDQGLINYDILDFVPDEEIKDEFNTAKDVFLNGKFP